MRRGLLVMMSAWLLVGGCVAGCATTRPAASQIVGVVEVCGDPMLRATAAERARCTPQTGSASIFNSRHRSIANTRLEHGRFDFRVAPGSYTLTAWNSGNGPWKRAVLAAAGRTEVTNIHIAI